MKLKPRFWLVAVLASFFAFPSLCFALLIGRFMSMYEGRSRLVRWLIDLGIGIIGLFVFLPTLPAFLRSVQGFQVLDMWVRTIPLTPLLAFFLVYVIDYDYPERKAVRS